MPVNPNPTARQLDPGHAIDSAFPARFLKPWHLSNNGIDTFTDTVAHAQMEQVTADGKTYEEKLVLYFERAKTPYLVSAKADINTLKSRYRVTTFGDLVGLRITLEIVHDRRYGELLRIKPTPPPTPASAPPADEPDDEPAMSRTMSRTTRQRHRHQTKSRPIPHRPVAQAGRPDPQSGRPASYFIRQPKPPGRSIPMLYRPDLTEIRPILIRAERTWPQLKSRIDKAAIPPRSYRNPPDHGPARRGHGLNSSPASRRPKPSCSTLISAIAASRKTLGRLPARPTTTAPPNGTK